MSARDRILNRIKRVTVDASEPAPARTKPHLAQPKDRVAQFLAQAEAVQASG